MSDSSSTHQGPQHFHGEKGDRVSLQINSFKHFSSTAGADKSEGSHHRLICHIKILYAVIFNHPFTPASLSVSYSVASLASFTYLQELKLLIMFSGNNVHSAALHLAILIILAMKFPNVSLELRASHLHQRSKGN